MQAIANVIGSSPVVAPVVLDKPEVPIHAVLLFTGIELLWTLSLSFPSINMAPTIFRISNFLPVELHDQFLQFVQANQLLFRPSTTTPSVLHDFPDKHLLLDPLRQALSLALSNLQLLEFPVERIETELCAIGNGNYQPSHVDNNCPDTANRFLSFAYFFSANPQPFRGGELVVHGSEDAIVLPIPNSIVFYTASQDHEVLQTTNDGSWHNSRFSIEGWYRMGSFDFVPAPPSDMIEMGLKPGGFELMPPPGQQLSYQYPNRAV